MAFSDDLRGLRAGTIDFGRLDSAWENKLKDIAASTYGHFGEEAVYYPSGVAGFVTIQFGVHMNIQVGYYDAGKDAACFAKLNRYDVGIVLTSHTGWDDSAEFFSLEEIKRKTIRYEGQAAPGTVVKKYEPRVNPAFSLYEEADAQCAAQLIRSCDDGSFQRYRVTVRKISLPAYVEEYVTMADAKGKTTQFETAFRAVGETTKYAVNVDILW